LGWGEHDPAVEALVWLLSHSRLTSGCKAHSSNIEPYRFGNRAPRLAFVFDEPALSRLWDGVVQMSDKSLQPPVIVTMSCHALREALPLAGVADADLPRFVRANKAAFTALSESLFAHGRFEAVRVDIQLAPAFQQIRIGVDELRRLPSPLRDPRAATTLAVEPGPTP
jgi:hypothetical protein